MCSYDDVHRRGSGIGQEALVMALPPDTKSSFPFRPNAGGFAVRVRKVMSTLGWEGAKHNVLEDISKDGSTRRTSSRSGWTRGFGYPRMAWAWRRQNLEQDYGTRDLTSPEQGGRGFLLSRRLASCLAYRPRTRGDRAFADSLERQLTRGYTASVSVAAKRRKTPPSSLVLVRRRTAS